MRNLVQPPPSVHCELCDGELRLKLITPDDSVVGMDGQIFVCAKCRRERSYSVWHDRYAAHTASNMPRPKMGQPGRS